MNVSRRPRSLRILLILPLCIALTALLMWTGLKFATWALPTDSDADLQAICKEGQSIVDAIYAYRAANGIWPSHLEELTPRFAGAEPPSKWQYDWSALARNRLWTTSPSGRWRVTYVFCDDERAGWCCESRDGSRRLDSGVSSTQPAARPAPNTAAAIVELQRRTVRYPQELIHRQGLFSFLVQSGKQAEALKVSQQCEVDFAKRWWPHYATASLMAMCQQVEAGDTHLFNWATADPSFARYWYQFAFRIRFASPEQAMAALEIACQHPFRSSDQAHFIPEFMALAGSQAAYKQGRHELVLTLCDRWSNCRISGSDPEPSHRAMRAASLLALGRFNEAEVSVSELIEIKKQRAIWAGRLEELKKAIAERNQRFEYRIDFGASAKPELLVTYE